MTPAVIRTMPAQRAERNGFAQKEPAGEGSHHVTDRGHRHYVAQIRPTQKRHVR